MKSVLAAFVASAVLAGATCSANAAGGGTITFASLDSNAAKTGWLKVLSEGGQPKAKTRARRDVNHSPIPRELVAFQEDAAPGTIVVDNSERRLYHVLGRGIAMKYAISVGREGFLWTGTNAVSRKSEWPTWVPPEEMRAREAKKGKILPVSMKGGIDNPLGARAIYLGSTIYRIHGTNQPSSIGKAMSSGCIRMANEDVEHLYANVSIGTKVIVHN
ncbi:L,D-transpeptidase [Sinorhizobium numidicum]|uniref:L,D-transpeptidase n=1 Tax=Sinorhizobium numidicum TaxID=680248 RepID=A0ABY8CZ40_9HYPH|nr:L,D-transpeptidase [Sinorhizobium numidicum]WEX75984.1 L,D-transpeptidase [Sinorhizobium numidicum]WEX82643.1 L,D-transpeptidase [Sinorhizobium numidicum]